MSFKKYLLLCLFLVIGCGSPDREKDQIKVFLTEWANLLKSKNGSVRRFYDNQFVFPKVVFQAEGLHYNFDIENIKIVRHDEKDYIHVVVPFEISDPNDTNAEQGQIELTISKTEDGFVIRDMTQEFAEMIEEHQRRLQVSKDYSEKLKYEYDTMLTNFGASALAKLYDSVVFYTEVDNKVLFYVANGSWQYPYEYDKQRDGGSYKVGVVTAENEIIVPIEFTKIYNPNGSFDGMIEVENNGLRGLFSTKGKAFIPAEFDGVYPTKIEGAFAQVRKGERYGWVDTNGRVSFDSSSHVNKKLFQSPVENNEILGWAFKYPGTIKVLNPFNKTTFNGGIIIYPSFVKDFGITAIANDNVMLKQNDYAGTSNTEIRFEKVESISDRLFGLVSFFMEAGVSGRDYHSQQNNLIVVNKNLNKLRQQKIISYEIYHVPCGTDWQYKKIGPGLYESNDGIGTYNYYKIMPDGNIEQLETVRSYNFTKFVNIDESYFRHCQYESLKYNEPQGGPIPNVVVTQGISMDELDIMRNEIFAEYGFIFKSPKWKKYFESKPWYKPQHDNVDQFLTEIDKHNIKFLLEFQRENKDHKVQRDSIIFPWAGG